jgi:hypothetical protein
MKQRFPPWAIGLSTSIFFSGMPSSIALPPPSDIPKEVLRNETILDKRSPINGEPMTAAEYVEFKDKLAESPYPPQINSKLQQLIFLLQVRKFVKTVIPLPLPFLK